MSGISSIYNVSSNLNRGYQANIKNKTLIERMQSEHPGMIEKVAETIDSTLDNALAAIRVEPRFASQKKTLDQMETKWRAGGYKANFAANLKQAEKTYEKSVSPKMKARHRIVEQKLDQIVTYDEKTGEANIDVKKAQAYLASEKRHLYTVLKMPLMPNEKID